ncbi:MAG: hypothetical protein JO000_30290, partial [Alphaproteobacteria bacterium]|nr:hypothetical protein [Alphaproteobacteria bacterium]
MKCLQFFELTKKQQSFRGVVAIPLKDHHALALLGDMAGALLNVALGLLKVCGDHRSVG